MDESLKQLIREYVQELVQETLDEAVRRDKYVDDIVAVLRGALGEYLKARYSEANGDPDPFEREHWDKEVDEHFMFKFNRVVTRRARFGQGAAFEEALADLRVEVSTTLRWAKAQVASMFKLDIHKMVDPLDSRVDEFFARASNEFDACFEALTS